MQKLFKVISKPTGNLCFGASREDGDYLVYVSRQTKDVSYAATSRVLEGVCYQQFSAGSDYFLATHGDNWITQFDGSTVNSAYVDASPYEFCEITKGKENEYFAIDKSTSKLVKFELDFDFPGFSMLWEISLQDFNFANTGILYRGSNRTVVLNDNEMVYVIRDDQTSGHIISKSFIPGEGATIVSASGEFNPEFTYLRYRQVSGDDLEQTSSSSLSSLSTDSSESSTSSSSSSLGTSSSSSIGTSSSSSSFGTSSSSSRGTSSSSSSFGTSSSSSLITSSSSSLKTSSSSSSNGTSSSSSYGENELVNYVQFGWENLIVTPDYDYNDDYVTVWDNELKNRISMIYQGVDSNGQKYYKMYANQNCTLIVNGFVGSNSVADRFQIIRNSTVVDDYYVILSSPPIIHTTNVTMSQGDELKIRIISPTGLDIYQYQTYPSDNRVRAKVDYWE